MPVAVLFVVVGLGGAFIAGGTQALCETACAAIPVWPFFVIVGIGVLIAAGCLLERLGSSDEDEQQRRT